MGYHCFAYGCKCKAQFLCLCLSSETFCCEIHLKEHLKIPNRSHAFNSVLSKLQNWTKQGILKFLTKEQLKKNKLKSISLAHFTKNSHLLKGSIKKSLKELDSDIKEINDFITKMTEISEEEEIYLLNALTLPADSGIEEMLPNGSNIRLFCRLGQLKKKKLSILNRANNDLKTEQDFRRTCALYENDANHWLLRQAYKEYINAYQNLTSIYHAKITRKEITLFKYDTESESVNILEIPYERKDLIKFTIKLPNGEIFIHGWKQNREQGINVIIDKKYRIRELPLEGSERFRTAIYFNKCIYCFGYHYISDKKKILSARFDLDEERLIKLAPIEKCYSGSLKSSIIFNGNILISLDDGLNFLLYSIDIDSFSTIPYKKKEKFERENNNIFFVNSEERLYLIELNGWIYESEVKNEYNWKKISFSGIHQNINKTHFSYNKEGIYFSLANWEDDNARVYLKFDLGKKTLIEVACYDDDFAIKRLDGKLIELEGFDPSLKFDSDRINNGYTLYYIFKQLRSLEFCNRDIIKDPQRCSFHRAKGSLLHEIGWYLEAIECYNEAIQLKSTSSHVYIAKGDSLHKLGRNIEALECYNTAIQLKPFYNWITFRKGLALHDLERNIEAIECYNESIKDGNEQRDYVWFCKGVALHDLGRNDEAMECYNIVIKNNKKNHLYYLYRGYLYNDLGKEEQSMQDFNSACFYLISKTRNKDGVLIYNCHELLKMFIKILKDTIQFKNEIEKLRNSGKNINILIEAEEKESIIKEQSSKLIKRAIECLDFDKCKPAEEILQISKEVSKHQKEIAETAIQLSLFLQNERIIISSE